MFKKQIFLHRLTPSPGSSVAALPPRSSSTVSLFKSMHNNDLRVRFEGLALHFPSRPREDPVAL